MRRLALLLLFGSCVTAGGCATDPGPDVAVYDGPYYYGGGGYYYDEPRSFEYDYDRRYVHGRTYYYPGPYHYGGYRHDHRGRPDTDYRRRDDNSTADRQRERGDRSPSRVVDRPPQREPDARTRDRAVPDRPSKAAAEAPGRSTRSDADRGSPRGNPGRSGKR